VDIMTTRQAPLKKRDHILHNMDPKGKGKTLSDSKESWFAKCEKERLLYPNKSDRLSSCLTAQDRRKIKSLRDREITSKSSQDKDAEFVTFKELAPSCCICPKAEVTRQLRGDLSATESRPITLVLGADQAITSDGSGLIQTVISTAPGNCSNWSNYITVFDEFRVLAVQLTFEPTWGTGGATTIFFADIASAIDRDDSVAMTSYNVAERYTSHKQVPGQKTFRQTYTIQSVDEGIFIQTVSSPTGLAWIKLYSSGNTISTTVGRADIRYVVQFRSLGIV